MNARQFRYILVLAAEGSFSKAAKVLNISQPSLSQYVKKIELSSGVVLPADCSYLFAVTKACRMSQSGKFICGVSIKETC